MTAAEKLPSVRGRLRENADIGRNTWFQVGGPAEVLFKPEDAADLADFFRGLGRDVPVTVIGVGSNLLVRDGGVAGVVVRLGRGFTAIYNLQFTIYNSSDKQFTIQAGAGCLNIHAAAFAREYGIAGLEFLCGIPGTVGGGVMMNAGAYGSDVSRVLESAEVVLRSGEIRTFSNAELGFSYRHSGLPEGAVVVSATLRGVAGDTAEIRARMEKIMAEREATQPIRSRTGGSTFKNPPGKKAWELIDAAGCRGLMVGGAKVSEQHCNFLINTGTATATDIETLGEEVRRRVQEKSGVELEWEIRRIGRA